MSDLFNEMMEEISEKDKKIADLEAKLAERKQFCESQVGSLLEINSELFEVNEKLKQQLAEKEHELDIRTFEAEMNAITITKMRESKHQDKISFCIEQLEKVKEYVIKCVEEFSCVYVEDMLDEIDNQIKQLTHQHEDKG